MICNGKKVKEMEVYVAVKVNVEDCKTMRCAYRKSENTAQKITDLLEGDYEVCDFYEVIRNEEGEIIDPEDEE